MRSAARARAAPSQQSAGPPDTYVTSWDAVGTQAFSAAGLTPAEGHVVFAYVAIAVYDSVMAIEGGHEPFAIDVDAPEGASAEAAVAAAAHRVFRHYLPAQAGILDPAYIASLATIPDSQAKTDGIALGEAVAALFIAQRAGDGFRAPVTYTPPSPPIPGVWDPNRAQSANRPIPGAHADVRYRLRGPVPAGRAAGPLESEVGTGLQRGQGDRLEHEHDPDGRADAGRHVRRSRPYSRHAVPFASSSSITSSTLRKPRAHGDGFRDLADALIACFDAKYHYKFWRPITAIRAGDTDGNEATVGDPSWSTLLAGTPNHPEYPSAHSCVTPAGGLIVASFLGTPKIEFTVPSLTGLGDRHFPRAKDLEDEVSNAALGRYPLPLRGRGRGRDRQEDRPPRARAPLQAVERLDRAT